MLNIEVHMKPLKESAPLQHWSCCQAFFRSANGSISVKVVARNNNNNNDTHTHIQYAHSVTTTRRRGTTTTLPLKRTFTAKVDFLLRHFAAFYVSFVAVCLLGFYLRSASHKTELVFRFPRTPLILPGHHYSLPLSRSKQSGARGCVHPQKCL